MRLCLIYIIIFLNLFVVQGQNQRFKNLSIKEGLSQSTVNAIIQDNKGLIWIGTQDGLNRYDGYEFIHYKKQLTDTNSIPDNNIQALYEDTKGNIWIGTYGSGVAIYNPKTNQFKRINTTNSKLSDDIIMCFKEHNDVMYIGTKRGGLNVYDYNNKTLKPIGIENNFSIHVRDIEISNNTVFVVTSLGGIHFLDKSIWIKVLDTIQIQMMELINEKLWLGGVNGEVYYNESNNYKFEKLNIESFNSAGIWGISADNTDGLWLGTFGSGLIKINQHNNKLVNRFYNKKDDVNSISHDVILTLFKDKDDGIWIGTLGGGVNYFEPNNQKFKHYNDVNGLTNNVVMSFLEDNNNLYVGTYGGGLNVLDLNTNKFSQIKQIEATIIRCIYKDTEGLLWIGTYGNGLIKFNPQTKVVEKILNKLVDDVWCVKEDLNGELWIGTWGSGLIKYNKANKSVVQYLKNEHTNSISENTILSLAIAKNGNVWIGTYGSGLNYLDVKSNQFKFIGFEGKNDEETNNKKIRSIYIDKNEDLWIGTDGGGLNFYNQKTKKINYITTENKLPNNVIYGIIQDYNNNIWVSTNFGLSRYSVYKQTVTNFDYDDGLQNNEFNQGALYLSKNEVYAGGINGFNIFNVKNIELSTKQSKTIISSMKVMGKEIEPPIRFLDSLSLNYTNNFLSFQFSHLDYTGKIVYRCKLLGLDKDWIYLEDRNFINYTNLPPGKYILQYQGKRVGDWGDDYAVLTIVIPPPFWKTTWFYTLTVLLLVVGLYLFYVYKQRSLKRKNAALENQVKIRTHEIQLKNVILEEQKHEVEVQKEIIETKHAEIQSSINYAKRIQSAILPSLKIVKEYLNDSFILYKPKDIVAGDFYWLEHKDGKILFAAADCTGHGVPGAMVSVVCNNGLNRSVREYGLTDPGEILNKTREIVIAEFEKSEDEVRDGMDIALCALDGNVLKYAGAQNSLWIIRKGAEEIEEIKADKQPIGRHSRVKPFTTHTITLEKGDTFYIFSDGYYDQFGGDLGKKLKSPNFKKLLLSMQNQSMDKQRELIDQAFYDWKGNLEQVDDVCVIGVRF